MKLVKENTYKGKKYTIEIEDGIVSGSLESGDMSFQSGGRLSGSSLYQAVLREEEQFKDYIDVYGSIDWNQKILDLGFKSAEIDLDVRGHIVDPNIYYTKGGEAEYPRDHPEAEKGDWLPGGLKRGRIITYGTPGIKKWIIINDEAKEVLVEWDNKHGYFHCAVEFDSEFRHTRQPYLVFETESQAQAYNSI